MQFSPLVGRIAGGGARAWSVHFDAQRQRAEGRDVLLLTVGDPDQGPPEAVIAATVAALQGHKTGYSPIIGLPALRAAIAARVQRRTGTATSAENVAVVPGTQAGLYAALHCIAGPGDEVIAFEPTYATYEAVAGAAGATLVTVPLLAETGFHPDLAALARSGDAADARAVAQQPAQPDRRRLHPRRRSRPSQRSPGAAISGCSPTRSMRISPSPGRI